MRSTEGVKHGIAAVAAIATLLLLPACSHPTAKYKSPTAAASAPSGAASGGDTSAPPSGSPSSTAVEFTVDGAGPYQLGSMLTDLQAAPGLANVTTGGPCPGNTTAEGTGVWKEVTRPF